ncbi:hypothetical protein ACFGVS_16035 [Mucilaginibacter sp. AW1-7]|uniref:hypothetical protein n=1 Tax=Mucilaginibacter sp. AW1-7 TaxID=3349874 RepID=UPI003F73777F
MNIYNKSVELKNSFSFLFFFMTLMACNSPNTHISNNEVLNKDSMGHNKYHKPVLNSPVNKSDSLFDPFLNDCSYLLHNGSYIGSLQGVNSSRDSLANLCFAYNFKAKETYEVMFVFKGGLAKRSEVGTDSIKKVFYNGCENNFQDFDCFTFIHPINDPDKIDPNDVDNGFPAMVKIFKRISPYKWKFLDSQRLKSFSEYSNLRFRLIYEKK